MMHEVDYAIKVICGRHPNCFLDLFYGRDREVQLKGIEDTQLQIPEHKADKIWRVHDGEQEGCILLEAILEPAKRSFRRLNLKNATVQVGLNMPVITVLLYLQQGNYATFPDEYEDKLGSFVNQHKFASILLWEHAERIRKGELKELAPFLALLLALLYDEPSADILDIENELIESLKDEQEREELKSVAAILGARKFGEEIINRKLKLEFTMIRETTFFTEWGDQKYSEGRVEGRVEGEIKVLIVLLERKFGLLSKKIKNILNELTIDDSDALAAELLDFQSINDLRIWLKNRPLLNETN